MTRSLTPRWFRATLAATGVMNLAGAAMFAPGSAAAREMAGLPPGPPFYLALLATWVFAFGAGYLWLAVTGRREWLFVAIGACGKVSFAALLTISAVRGDLPLRAVGSGVWDAVIGILFVVWLISASREDVGQA